MRFTGNDGYNRHWYYIIIIIRNVNQWSHCLSVFTVSMRFEENYDYNKSINKYLNVSTCAHHFENCKFEEFMFEMPSINYYMKVCASEQCSLLNIWATIAHVSSWTKNRRIYHDLIPKLLAFQFALNRTQINTPS